MKTITRIFTLISMMLLLIQTGYAQTSFRARLSEVPVTPQTYQTITGVGEVFATLDGNLLRITGSFQGMSSVATAAHVHLAPRAMNGPPIGPLQPTAATTGDVSGELELTADQLTALQNESLYIVIHSQNNPGGEIRGWLFASES